MSNRLLILLYHCVWESKDPMRPDDLDATEFREQMEALVKYFNPLPLAEALALRERGELPARAISITFDDGYANNYSTAFPIMQELKVPLTIFIAAGFTSGRCMWNDLVLESIRRTEEEILDYRSLGMEKHKPRDMQSRCKIAKNLLAHLKYRNFDKRQQLTQEIFESCKVEAPENLMMNHTQIRELVGADVEIGGHTSSHPILSQIHPQQAREEIVKGKQNLEAIAQTDIKFFAYPNGRPDQDYGPEHVDMVKAAGFAAAVSSEGGVVDAKAGIYELPRFTPWAESPLKFTARIGKMLYW